MPRLDGIEAARQILDERPIPIVMLTASAGRLVSRAVEAGVFGYLVKPFREQDLLGDPAAQRATTSSGAARGGGVAADALAARKVIERAKGLLMEKEQLSEQEAFERLRQASQRPAAAEGDRGGRRRHARRGCVSEEHPNAALTRRVFAAFGKDAKAISAAFSRDIVWRVPGNTVMSGEYRGRRAVVEFLRRTGLETGGTYRSSLHTVFANDDWAIAIYRAIGEPQRHRPRRRPGLCHPL